MFPRNLSICLVLWLWLIEYNDAAATRVFYQFHIREEPIASNATESRCGNHTLQEQQQTKEIIVGERTSIFRPPGNESASAEFVYVEKAKFNHNETGYNVQYSVNQIPVDTRLGQTALKVITG